MKLKQIVDEVFGDYKECGMLLVFPECTWKCEGCQNKHLSILETKDFSIEEILFRYQENPFSKCIIFGGLEPFDSINDIMDFMIYIIGHEEHNNPLIIIYTGYDFLEINNILHTSKLGVIFNRYKNIILKYGRYLPDSTPYFNKTLGITLQSINQNTIDFRTKNTSYNRTN